MSSFICQRDSPYWFVILAFLTVPAVGSITEKLELKKKREGAPDLVTLAVFNSAVLWLCSGSISNMEQNVLFKLMQDRYTWTSTWTATVDHVYLTLYLLHFINFSFTNEYCTPDVLSFRDNFDSFYCLWTDGYQSRFCQVHFDSHWLFETGFDLLLCLIEW